MSHTPGPWTWGDNFGGLYAPDGEVLREEPYEGMWLAYGKYREANAKLIAAAPDLLAALEQIVEATQKDANPRALVLQIARAAIEKATK